MIEDIRCVMAHHSEQPLRDAAEHTVQLWQALVVIAFGLVVWAVVSYMKREDD